MRTARLALVAVLAALVACGGPVASPEEVALDFWSAVVADEPRAAANLANGAGEADVARLLGPIAAQTPPAIGAAAISEDSALVETIFLGDGSGNTLSFHTHLVRGDAGWRIDVGATASELTRARSAAP